MHELELYAAAARELGVVAVSGGGGGRAPEECNRSSKSNSVIDYTLTLALAAAIR